VTANRDLRRIRRNATVSRQAARSAAWDAAAPSGGLPGRRAPSAGGQLGWPNRRTHAVTGDRNVPDSRLGPSFPPERAGRAGTVLARGGPV